MDLNLLPPEVERKSNYIYGRNKIYYIIIQLTYLQESGLAYKVGNQLLGTMILDIFEFPLSPSFPERI